MLKPGTLVLLRNSARDGRKGDKFQACYLGPYEIAKHLGKNVFRLRNPTTGLLLKKSVNACRLKLYRERQRPPLHLSNTSLFQVNDILLLAFGVVQIILSGITHPSVTTFCFRLDLLAQP